MRTPKEIIEAVKMAGIVGAGGGGFPTHIKFDTRVDTVLANGSECEPLLNSDKALLLDKADRVVQGVQYAMTATGATRGIIAVKGKYTDVAKAVKKALPADGSITLHLLENYYPAGDEFLTVYDATGRVIPEGGLPLHVGVVVSNVLSLAQVAEAMDGKAVTERPVTIAGSVKNPQVVTVPIGTPYGDLIRMAGGTLDKSDVLIDGGPMMGAIVKDPEAGIAKTTSGLIALPEDHFIVSMSRINISQMVKKSKAACCQCIRCTDLCPRNLVGHKLFPHFTMRTIDYNLSEPTEHITSAFLCSQCGMCELVACDAMLLSPRKVYAEYRKLLVAKGIRNPHTRKDFPALDELEYRKVAVPTVMKKLGISQYAVKMPVKGYRSVPEVRIDLNRHAGVPAMPKVVPGEKVRIGDIIAASPMDKMGAVYHASINGKVAEVSENRVVIASFGVTD
ncbi:MAG: electron transport complex protein RnfC [bacterium]|nr:electron transport complex protein RnfC [bacterium]